jgi:hypothetical protein
VRGAAWPSGPFPPVRGCSDCRVRLPLARGVLGRVSLPMAWWEWFDGEGGRGTCPAIDCGARGGRERPKWAGDVAKSGRRSCSRPPRHRGGAGPARRDRVWPLGRLGAAGKAWARARPAPGACDPRQRGAEGQRRAAPCRTAAAAAGVRPLCCSAGRGRAPSAASPPAAAPTTGPLRELGPPPFTPAHTPPAICHISLQGRLTGGRVSQDATEVREKHRAGARGAGRAQVACAARLGRGPQRSGRGAAPRVAARAPPPGRAAWLESGRHGGAAARGRPRRGRARPRARGAGERPRRSRARGLAATARPAPARPAQGP